MSGGSRGRGRGTGDRGEGKTLSPVPGALRPAPCRRAFTLIEVLVSALLLAIGIAAVVQAFGALTDGEFRTSVADRAQRLAIGKYEELVATGEIDSASLSGDFSEQGEEDYEWTAEVVPTGVENLEALTVTVTRIGSERLPQATVEGLVHRPPPPTGGTQ